jgi:8-oxo-dGTP pyrophosphatase MutT (NUDIX family)
VIQHQFVEATSSSSKADGAKIGHDEAVNNPWKTVATAVKYDNPWIQVREDSVIRPSGDPGIYGVVHFKNRAIGVIPIDAEGYTYLVGQWRYALEQYSWELPEGGGPLEEHPLAAAKRELLEETGFRAEHWRELFRMHLSNSVTDEEAIIYLATGLEAGTATPEETEVLQVRRVHLSEALELVLSGEITDSITVAAVLRASLMSKTGEL